MTATPRKSEISPGNRTSSTIVIETGTIAISYARRSKADNHHNRAVAQQSEANRQAVEDMGWTLAAEYFEPTAISASRFASKERPAWRDLLEHLRTQPADVIVMWEPSRGSRTMATWVEFLDLCRSRNVQIHITGDRKTYDPTDARDRRSLLEDGTDSEYESEKISKRIRRTTAANALAGLPHGRNIVGYERQYEIRNGESVFVAQVPSSDAGMVLDMFERFASGESIASLAREMGWDTEKVRRMLVNPAYIGKRSHRGNLVDAVWEGIVPEQIWQSCVDLLNDPTRRTNRGSEIKHILSGIAECAVCGSTVQVRRVSAVDYALRYYCREGRCLAVPYDSLNAYVIEKVKERLYTMVVSAKVDENDFAARENLIREIAEREIRLTELSDGLKRSKRPVAALIEAISELEIEIEDLKSSLRRPKVSVVVRKVVGAPESFLQRDLLEQRELIRSLVKIELLPAGKGRRLPIEQRVRLSDPITGQVW